MKNNINLKKLINRLKQKAREKGIKISTNQEIF